MSGGKAWPLASEQINESVRYEPEENPPHAVAVGAGVQAALSILAGIVLGVVIIVKVPGESEGYLAWAVFAALLVGGVATILQAVRVWRIGAGHVLMMGTSGAFIAVCVAALVEGGPPPWQASWWCHHSFSSCSLPGSRGSGGCSRLSLPA